MGCDFDGWREVVGLRVVRCGMGVGGEETGEVAADADVTPRLT